MASLYKILQLEDFASPEEVKRQYKKLALLYHPDRNPEDPRSEERFKLMTRAYTILSNPNKKTGYDQLLIARKRSTTQTKKATKRQTPFDTKVARQKRESRVDKWVSNKNFVRLGVFAFLGIGFIVYQIIWQANNFLIVKDIESQRTTREILLEQSLSSFEKGNIKLALDYLDMVKYDPAGKDIRLLRNQYLAESEMMASEMMDEGKFYAAVDQLSLLITRAKSAKEEWYVGLAICYKKVGKMNTSLEILEKLVQKNPDLLMANKELGHMYKNDLGEFEKALFYYERATAIIVNNYVDYYGKAYYTIINPENHPPTDYNVFVEKAKIYSSFGRLKDSNEACKWALVLRPEASEPNLIMGRNLFEQGKVGDACKALKKAEKKGALIPPDLEGIQC